MAHCANVPLNDYCTAFVRWLTIRTLEGRARWKEHPNGWISQLTDSTLAQLITDASKDHQAWLLFRVRDNSGELFRTTSVTFDTNSVLLKDAVDALFVTITSAHRSLVH